MKSEPVKAGPRRIKKRPEAFHHGDLRAAAIHVAVREVEERGHADLSLERLAAKLGVTRPALYRHFKDRDSLLAAVAAEGFGRFAASFEAALRSTAAPGDALLAAGRAYVRFAAENPGWFRLQFSRGQTQSLRGQQHMVEPPAYVALMHGHIDALLGRDHPSRDAAYRLLWAQAHGLAGLVVERALQLVKTDAERLAVADETLAFLIESLRALARTRRAR